MKDQETRMKAMGKLMLRCALLLLVAVQAHAQQDPMYTMYMWNMMGVNPGYAGSADVLNATVLARRQWVGMEGAPATNSIMAHTPLRSKALGTGISVIDDRIGPSRSTGIFTDIAYRVRVNAKGSRLAFGLKAGFNAMRMNLGAIPGTDLADPVFQRDISGGLRPNFGFGMYYWSKKGYAGISAPKLLQDIVKTSTENGTLDVFKERRHYFLIGGYVFDLGGDVKFRPSVLLKGVEGAPMAYDLSANFLFAERLWTGAAYRSGKELSAILSYQVNDQLRFGYAYDLSLSRIRTRSDGSHEVMLTYDFLFTKRLLRSPRYF